MRWIRYLKEGANFHSYCAGDMEIANEMNVLACHLGGEKKKKTNKQVKG